MNLDMTISARDKVLLYILGIGVFLFVFIRFGLMPALDGYNEAQDTLAAAEATREEMEYGIALASTAAQDKANALSERNTASAAFYTTMSNDALDTLVTGLTMAHDLEPLELNISSTQPQNLEGYVASARAGTGTVAATPAPTAEDAGPDADTDAAPDADTADTSGTAALAAAPAEDFIYTVQVSGRASGSAESFSALLDDLAANYPAIQLLNFSIEQTAYLTREDGVAQTGQYHYTLAVYMCDRGVEQG